MSDVFSFEITQGGGPPAGNYRAKFLGVEQHDHEQYGPGLRWKWEVAEGPQAGDTLPVDSLGRDQTFKTGDKPPKQRRRHVVGDLVTTPAWRID